MSAQNTAVLLIAPRFAPNAKATNKPLLGQQSPGLDRGIVVFAVVNRNQMDYCVPPRHDLPCADYANSVLQLDQARAVRATKGEDNV